MRNTDNTDWNFESLIQKRGIDYLEDVRHIKIVAMDDAYDLLPEDYEYNVRYIAQKIYYGGHWDGRNNKVTGDFEYWADYVIDDRDGWYSLNAEDRDGFIRSMINEDDFYDWCVDWGYIDNGEGDE